jgi:hypothetical protein
MNKVMEMMGLRLSNDRLDARLAQLVCDLGGLVIIPIAIVAITKHTGSRGDIFLGTGLAGVLGLLCVLMGMLCRRNCELQGKMTLRSRWPELASDVGCLVTLIAGIKRLPQLGMTPAQITLGLLVTCSLSIAMIVFGMTTTLVRSPRG